MGKSETKVYEMQSNEGEELDLPIVYWAPDLGPLSSGYLPTEQEAEPILDAAE